MSSTLNLDLIKALGQIAAPAGIAIGVFLYVARDLIAKNIFPVLTKERAYHVIVALAVMAWSIALAGIGAWMYVETYRKPTPTSEDGAQLPPHRLFTRVYGNTISISNQNCPPNRNGEVLLSPNRIFFPSEFDKEVGHQVPVARITKEADQVIKESIDWLLLFGNRVCSVVVFAGVDVHGSREHLLATGQRFADTVKKRLIKSGINEDFVEAMSYGKERAQDIFIAADHSKLDRAFNNFADIGVLLR